MNYYFIYSAGGGAGDWNGVKRMWAEYMPETLKSKILLKFGDIFLEHASGNNFIRPQRWRDINNLREWLSENVNDEFVESQACDILLDSGTAKAVNMIAHHNPRVSCERLIELFNKAFEDNRVFEKYTQIVHASQLNSAVTFDIPNPFKIRSQNGAARLNIIDQETNSALVRLSVAYANRMYEMFVALGGTEYANNTLSTIVNGLWSEEEMDIFFSGLNYSPRKLAVGGLSSTSVSETDIRTQMAILQKFDVLSFDKVHFLGCGGFKKVKAIKDCDIDGDNISVDCSTCINRSIDGSTSGATQSGYFDYQSRALMRITPQSKSIILRKHANVDNPLYSYDQMEDILDSILLHQSGHSSNGTYNARAKLIFHNADVFRRYANS